MKQFRNDTVVIAEAMPAQLILPKAITFPLKTQEGYNEVAVLIREGRIALRGIDIIVLLCGRADLWVGEKEFKEGVANCLSAIREVNSSALVLLNAPLPIPRDNRHNIKIINDRNNYLALLAEESVGLEFTKPGRSLICTGGPPVAFYDDFNNLNEAGLQLVRHGILCKFAMGSFGKRSCN